MNEAQEKEEAPDQDQFKLVPLTEEQHPVTPVAKFTTELPFFYLTKQKKLLEQDIHYEGVDSAGNPIRWDVMPNRNRRIGVPAIEAHTIWTRLVKPSMEIHRSPDGQIPEILPLGGIRECLRIIGWKEGGWEARGLLQGLMQTGQATCDVDFLLPTNNLDQSGRPLLRAVKGIFNRFSIWKIGSKHVSEEELAAGTFKFEFDLDDTLYIQLHNLERDIQRNQDQRYLDNQYMFSVEVRGRRWYELMAAKIFGVVKNNGSYCEIRYSWYIKHHHTLARLQTRSRVVSQMNRIVSDHVRSGFLTKIEYRAVRDERGEVDFVIRYYPGSAARESVSRVLSFITNSTMPILLERRRSRKQQHRTPRLARTPQGIRPAENFDSTISRSAVPIQTAVIHPSSSDEPVQISELEADPEQGQVDPKLFEALTSPDRGVTPSVAGSLLAGKSDEELLIVRDCVEYWDSIPPNKKEAGLLIHFIRKQEIPATFETSRKRAERQAKEQRATRLFTANQSLELAYERYQSDALDRYIETEFPREEYQRLHDEHKRQMSEQGSLFENRGGTMIEKMLRGAVRAEIRKTMNIIPFAEFCRREARRILADYQIDPAELGIVCSDS